jgi:hypothetical protein
LRPVLSTSTGSVESSSVPEAVGSSAACIFPGELPAADAKGALTDASTREVQAAMNRIRGWNKAKSLHGWSAGNGMGDGTGNSHDPNILLWMARRATGSMSLIVNVPRGTSPPTANNIGHGQSQIKARGLGPTEPTLGKAQPTLDDLRRT